MVLAEGVRAPTQGADDRRNGCHSPGCLLQSARLQGEGGAVEAESYIFRSFQLFPGQRLLLDNGKALPIGGRALDILTVLVEAAGETVANSQIMARAWPATTVEEGSLRVHIGALRKALGDGRGGNSFIANNPGRGYTFVAPVRRGKSAQPATGCCVKRERPADATRQHCWPRRDDNAIDDTASPTPAADHCRRRRNRKDDGGGGSRRDCRRVVRGWRVVCRTRVAAGA